MFNTINTLFKGANARAEEKFRDHFAIDLIDQKIREAQVGLQAAKSTLASLIMRERNEQRQIEALKSRVDKLTESTVAALADGREKLASEAAQGIAQMENEMVVRRDTAARIDTKITRLRNSVEAANRRIIDLKQSAITAKAIHQERRIQVKLNSFAPRQNSIEEAEELISRVIDQDDPFEQSEILREIDANLRFEDIGDRLNEQGYGVATKTTAADVLARLQSETN